MAQGLLGSITKYNRIAQITFAERLAENTAVFNANSGACLTLGTEVVPGMGATDTYWARSSTAGAARRDITSTSSITKIADSNAAEKKAKQFCKYTPYAMSISAIHNTADAVGNAQREEDYIRARSVQLADDAARLMANVALSAVYGAIQNTTANINDQSASTITSNMLQDTLQKVGDQQGMLSHVMMHSAVRSKLVTTSISANRYDDVAPVLNGADPATLGRMQVITDNTNMSAGSPAVYRTYFMKPQSVIVNMRETVPLFWEVDELTENISLFSGGEFEVQVAVPGYTYAGTDNPTDATLATQASWTQKAVQDSAIGITLLKSLA